MPVRPHQVLRNMSLTPRYIYPRLDNIEDLEKYSHGGFHPLTAGDVFKHGQYQVLHKLGFGGSSTLWLAREKSGRLVTLKFMSAEQSSKPLADLYILKELEKQVSHDHPGRESLPVLIDYFSLDGPNGSHLCLATQFAGPSLLSMQECPGRVSGSRRLRADLARKVAKQVAVGVDALHSAGVVHGDITSSNILFRVSDIVQAWSNLDIYTLFGNPEGENVRTRDGSPPGPSAPMQVVAPIDPSSFRIPSILQDNILLVDFGQSFFRARPPSNNNPATPLHYLAPESFFDSELSFASDIWALACTIFEIRAGAPLFEPLLSTDANILKQMVEVLDRLPDPWWSAWQARRTWFDGTGELMPEGEQRKKTLLPASKSSLRQKLCEIGLQDDPPESYEGTMIEATGKRLDEAEIGLLVDLLQKMLRYRPEDRISVLDVLRHPWFEYN